MKGFLVAAPASGSGKTTVAAGLMAALRKRGLRVQPFKCGPDFIDPGHHTHICGRPSHNLDTWMLPTETNRRIFASACHDADIAVGEGMMGLFDGVSGGGEAGSSAEMAKLLGLPIVLVADASMAARSLAATVYGFKTFDPGLRIAAVILNLVAGEDHARLLRDALTAYDPTLPVGWLPRRDELRLKERYLGLHTAEEACWDDKQVDLAAELIEKHIPLDKLLDACEIALPAISQTATAGSELNKVRIGVACDAAFSFYYEAGLDALRAQGAEIIPFSPLADSHLPLDLDALYFGGGYPELHTEKLSTNKTLLADLRNFATASKPIYGECGGLIFLSRKLTTLDGRRWPMADLLPLSIAMTERLVHFGYAEVAINNENCLLAPNNSHLHGHSFHCSHVEDDARVAKQTQVHYTLSGKSQPEGYSAGSVYGSYIHLHFASDPAFAARFVERARAARRTSLLTEVRA